MLAVFAPRRKRTANRVHCGVAAANHDHVAVLAGIQWLVELRETVRPHQVHAGKKLVRRVDSVEVLSRNIEEAGQTSSGRDEDGVEIFILHQLVDGDRFADYNVGFEDDTTTTQHVNFVADDIFR